MVKFRSRLFKNRSSASWNIFLCNKSINFIYVYKNFSQVTVLLGEIFTFLCNHFTAILPLPWDSNITFTTFVITFRFCFQLFNWIILSLEHKNSNYLWWKKGNLAFQNCAKFISRFGHKEAFNQKITQNHCQSFLHKHNEWRLFKPNTYARNVIFMPQQLLNRPQPYLLMHLTTVILIIMTSFSTLLSYSVKK